MVNNVSIKEMGEILRDGKSAILFPHVNADGDAAGSCAALCMALRQLGIETWILCEEPLAKYLSFIGCEYFTTNPDCIEHPDLCVAVDCGEDQRLNSRAEKYHSGNLCLCIDHHYTGEPFGDYYYIDADEAATAQIIFEVISSMIEDGADIKFTEYIADGIFTAISSDTGNFQYSNTTAKTHRIAAKLMDMGINHNDIIVNLYQNKNPIDLALESKALSHMELFADGKAAITYVTGDMLKECGATMENAESIINLLRDIAGVEIAAVLKEKEPGIVKASLRAKSYGDVGAIASHFGGGGHLKAAGCTFRTTMSEALESLKEAMSKAI